MARKVLASLLLIFAAVFAVPATAQAAGYVGQGTNLTLAVGETGSLTFTGLTPSTPSTASADDAVTLAVIRASTFSRPTDATGSVTYSVTVTKPGTYTVTVTAGQSVATATLTVTPADSAGGGTGTGGIAETGVDFPMLLVWVGGGALILGAAFIVVRATVRRNRA